jgi:UDP-N-acetylglucosamine 1-carboxyvinyltransferase
MSQFIIEGGHRLRGEVTPGGNKNEALPCLAASLLTDEPVIFNNLPRIRDVNVMLEIIESLGGSVEELESPNRVKITCRGVSSGAPDRGLCARLRASILLAGPLLGRQGQVALPPPGGDVIGRRRLDTHFEGLKSLGATFNLGESYELASRHRLIGGDIFMDEASVTATENILMAAATADGETIIRNAACEPHVQGLCKLLEMMGASIEGSGTNTIRISGTDQLGGCEYTIGPDYLEVGSFIGLAACTDSDIIIRKAGIQHLRMILRTFEKLGINVESVGDDDLRIRAGQILAVRQDLHGAIPRIDDSIWPAFPTDLMSIVIVTATQARGTVLFFEKMFEGRMFFVDRLIAMGASIILCDPHRVVVVGPSQLYASRVESPDVRAGMALLIAALSARGKTVIGNIRQVDRGYERIDEKLLALGARIERVNE